MDSIFYLKSLVRLEIIESEFLNPCLFSINYSIAALQVANFYSVIPLFLLSSSLSSFS